VSVLDEVLAELEAEPEKAARLHAALADAVDPDRRFSPEEMAVRWKANPRTVERWCRDGRIPSASKVGSRWFMPADAVVLPKQRKNLGPARSNASAGLAAGDAAGRSVLEAMKPVRRGRAA
jgi:hypothetical protein